MSEVSFIIFEILAIMGLFIAIFIYSALSTETVTVLSSYILFLILIFPFYLLIIQLNLLIKDMHLENLFFFKILVFYSTLINIFIGIYLFFELVYIFFFT